MRAARGVSIVSILVVVAILAVIAAFAFPAWRTSRTTDHLDQALKAGDAAKLVVMEAATTRGGLSHLQTGDLNYNAAPSPNPYVSKIDVSQTGRITITTQSSGSSPDPTFLLTPIENAGGPNSPVSWNCDIIAGNDQIKPASCTGAATTPTTDRSAMPPSSARSTPN
jgi:type IV pilus assembly protein PilA